MLDPLRPMPFQSTVDSMRVAAMLARAGLG